MRRNGFTLLEVMIAIILSAGLLVVTIAFFEPCINLFRGTLTSTDIRLSAVHTLESIGNDVEGSRAIYVDPDLCYATCMVNKAGTDRIYYYWGSGLNANTLYRKQEPIANALACSGGTTVAHNLDPASSSFGMEKDMLIVQLKADDGNNNTFKVSSSFFPIIQERDVILSESFECNTLKDGWEITLGNGRTNWSIVPAVQNLGSYEIADNDISDGTDTTHISMPIDLSRLSQAHMSFRYRNDGTITASDSFVASIWDGANWQTVFSDTSHASVAASKSIEVDLTPYSLNTDNIIRFSSTLSTAGAKWYVDQISVYNP